MDREKSNLWRQPERFGKRRILVAARESVCCGVHSHRNRRERMIPRIPWTRLLLFAAVLVSQPAAAQDASSSSKATQPNQQDSFDSLSRGRYSQRMRATLDMWRDRESSRQRVQEAAKDPDPEVSGRAKWILRQWRRGSQPDTPPEIHRLLQKSNGSAAIERLLEGGQLQAAVVAVEESIGTADAANLREKISEVLRGRFPIYVHHAIERDELGNLLRLVDLVADSKELAVCRIQMMREMGLEFDETTLLPQSAEHWSLAERQRATVLVLLTLNDIDAAMEFCKQSGDEKLLRQCRMIGGRWAEVAQDSLRRAGENETGSYDHTRFWCQVMIAADRARDQATFDQAVEVLTAPEALENSLADELRWKCLASHGRVDAALEILEQVSPHSFAALSIDASRTSGAFDALGFPLHRIDNELDQWVDNAMEAQRVARSADLVDQVRKVLTLIQCLTAVGRDDAAWRAAERLCRCDVKVNTLMLREYVLSTLTMTKRSDWVIKLPLSKSESKLSFVSKSTIARTLADGDVETLDLVMRALALMDPGRSEMSRMRSACALIEGVIPDGFDPTSDFRRLYNYSVTSRRSRRVGTVNQTNGIMATLGFVRMLARHGESDLASDCLQKLVRTGQSDALFFLAQQELVGGRAETAEALFESSFQKVKDRGQKRPTRTQRSTQNGAMAVKALIGMRAVSLRRGEQQTADKLTRAIRLSLCSPSASLRKEVADHLGEQGDQSLALEVYQALLPMAVLGNPENEGIYDVARGYSLLARHENPAEAARWFDLVIGGTLESMNFRPGAYVTLPLYVRRWSLEAAIDREDAVDVRHHLDRILRLDPLDIDFAERLLPKMREMGMEEMANDALDAILDEGLTYCKAFPFDAMTSNNLAWVAAINERRLGDALQLSQQAVYAEPESAIYRDTLAEVLFLLDRKREALQVERGCLLDDPGQWHLHEQVEKYEQSIQADAS